MSNHGKHVHNLFVVLFLIADCYQCFNHSLSMFDLALLSLEEYLPLDENLQPASFVADSELGTVFDFHAVN